MLLDMSEDRHFDADNSDRESDYLQCNYLRLSDTDLYSVCDVDSVTAATAFSVLVG